MGGRGIHVGLTALWECVIAKHATLSAKSIKDSVVVNMDGQSYGKMRSILKEKDEFFIPFINKLREDESYDVADSEVEDTEEGETKKKGKK